MQVYEEHSNMQEVVVCKNFKGLHFKRVYEEEHSNPQETVRRFLKRVLKENATVVFLNNETE